MQDRVLYPAHRPVPLERASLPNLLIYIHIYRPPSEAGRGHRSPGSKASRRDFYTKGSSLKTDEGTVSVPKDLR